MSVEQHLCPVSPEVQAYWDHYIRTHGTPPGRNEMAKALSALGIGRDRAQQVEQAILAQLPAAVEQVRDVIDQARYLEASAMARLTDAAIRQLRAERRA
jgi:hypothetical protein